MACWRESIGIEKKFFTSHGSPIKIEYGWKVLKDGSKILVETGKTDISAEIESHKEGVLLENIVKRYMLGDENALNVRKGLFCDITEFPTSLQDMYQKVIDTEKFFNSLSTETKELFNNSPEQFIIAMSENNFKDIENNTYKHVQNEKTASAAKDEAVAESLSE